MSAESPRHVRTGGPLTVPSQPPSDRSIIDAVSGFINDVTLSSTSTVDPKDVIQWARFETADINEPTPEGDGENDIPPLLLILGYGSGVQVWLIPPNGGEAQEVLSWRQGTVRVLRILPSPQHGDCFASKRPLISLCDSASPGPAFCSLSFISIRGGEQVKSIKFKNPILDVLANKRSVVVSFSERFAVFDAGTLEDRLAVTTCYPCPCPLGGSAPVNPIALGDRWLAYADKKLNASKRSSGGCESEGVTSYTATVLHAAKSLSKGLRGLGESVANSLAGGRGASQSPSPPHADVQQPGVVTILDVEGNEDEDSQDCEEPCDPIVAHFIAHSEAIIALKFDPSGMLLVTADRRGHDFHVFRVNPHPCGPGLASVHHLYVLHRGDTTAKVQDIAISSDGRWAAVSTLRGTTHVFAVSPYGGACGVRTHTQPRVVNRLSRFHRSAGLPIHASTAQHSPVCEGLGAGTWFPNPRLPPYPLPTTSSPLAQLRPTHNIPTHTITRTSSGRQRLSSLSEDNGAAPLLARAWFGVGGGTGRASSASLYLVAASGALLHLLLHPRPARGVPKEKISDDSPIELEVEAVAQWPLQRPSAAADLLAPLPPSNPLLQPLSCRRCADMYMSEEERWLSQVEIVTHAGPHRRLWMGPQFVFKTYNCTGSNSSLSEAETVEVEASAARSTPVNMPSARPLVPVLVDSGSASSLEHSPSDSRRKSLLEGRAPAGDVQLREDLAEAMKEDHGTVREGRPREVRGAREAPEGVARAVDPLGTVVAAPRAPAAPPAPDADAHTRANTDEAAFRPLAGACLPEPSPMRARALPRTTTIPAQPAAPHRLSPDDDPQPLNTDVFIPAQLTHVCDWLPPTIDTDDNSLENSITESVEPSKTEVSFTTRVSVANNAESSKVEVAIKEISKSQHLEQPKVDVEVNKEVNVLKHKKGSKTDVVVDKEVTESKTTERNRVTGKNKDVSVSKIKERSITDAGMKKEVISLKPTERLKTDVENNKEVKLPKNKERYTTDVEVKNTERSKIDVKVDEEVSMPKNKDCSKTDVKINDKEGMSKKKEHLKIDKVGVDREVSASKSNERFKIDDSENNEVNMPTVKSVIANVVSPNLDIKNNVNKSHTYEEDARKRESARDSASAIVELERKEKIVSLPRSNRPSDDIQPIARARIKKSPTTKTDSDNDKAASDISVKENVDRKKRNETKKEDTSSVIDLQSCVKANFGDDVKNKDLSKYNFDTRKNDKAATFIEAKNNSSKVTKPAAKFLSDDKRFDLHEIKTEEQAWDMLLNESEKSVNIVTIPPPADNEGKFDDSKVKAKKNRKSSNKKSQEEQTLKADEDSFIEIHAIDDKQQPGSEDLVSISTVLESSDSPNCYLARSRKPRSSKSRTPERKDVVELVQTMGSSRDIDCESTYNKSESEAKINDDNPIKDFLNESKNSEAMSMDTVFTLPNYRDLIQYSSYNAKESQKQKNKSNSPQLESYNCEIKEKEVYIIDTIEEDFPEIQITKGTRKRSPQLVEQKPSDNILVPKPIKSWSSIAASKNVTKVVKEETSAGFTAQKEQKVSISEEKIHPEVSLQEKLIELCKRTDIMVAECDAPSELKFIDEHHALLHDLPPLEPLDFGLDDFRLEVMRDSLLDVNETKINSPICKINIDDILSSIKETTSKVIESSSFNLVDIEKVPARREKGFSVVETDIITSQEVKLEDEAKFEKDIEFEKSSDDDVMPPGPSADGAVGAALPSKQSKSKKSRNKKK